MIFSWYTPLNLAAIQSKIIVDTSDYLDIEIVVDKTESVTTLTFLGVELDTLNFLARLPEEKLGKCCDKIRNILSLNKVSKLQLMSLAGLLNFACTAVRPVRPFMNNLHDKVTTIKSKYIKVKVEGTWHKDLTICLKFLDSYNARLLQIPRLLQC